MDLGPYLTFDGVDYECILCERAFASKHALYAHCRNTTRHAWCERCSRVFDSGSSKDAHLRASGRHNVCGRCTPARDFQNSTELKEHLVQYHHFCPDCNLYHKSTESLREHDMAKHHMCVECDRYFASENNLKMHTQKHQPRSMECCGCYKTFKSFSGVLIHLESGNCASDTTEEEIDCIAQECYQSRKYINDEFDSEGGLYKCPSCDTKFFKLSALYQHAEDVSQCMSLLNGSGCLAKLERFITQSV